MFDWQMFLSQDTLRTAIFAVGAAVALIELREGRKIRRIQLLSSFNERLAHSAMAFEWISNPATPWDKLKTSIKHDYQNYIATFEDVGRARSEKILSKNDFLRSYGGRYKQLYESKTLHQFIFGAGFDPMHFRALDILNKDIGMDI